MRDENKQDKTVLIIDDDTAITDMYKIKFNHDGISALAAWEGKEGIVLAQKHKVDLILLDILMLGQSGLNVLKELKQNSKTKDIPVIIFSNIPPDSDIKNTFLNAGAKEYIVKSDHTPQEVVDLCMKTLNQSILNKKGITLIESLIYVAIISGVVMSMVFFGLSIANARSKNYVVQEVHANGRAALQIIASQIRRATGVNISDSIFNQHPGRLSLIMDNPSVNPTIFDFNGDGILQIKQGASSPIAIVSDEVVITNLVFRDLTGGAPRENIQIEMTVNFNGGSTSTSFIYSKEFRTAVSVRQ